MVKDERVKDETVQGEGVQGEGVKGERVQGEGFSGERVQGEKENVEVPGFDGIENVIQVSKRGTRDEPKEENGKFEGSLELGETSVLSQL